MVRISLSRLLCAIVLSASIGSTGAFAATVKPVLHGRHWVAITGKPLGATAGAMIFQKGGNAVDAACAMLGATSTMWDTLGWGGETQALIFNPKTGKVIGINALGVAPSGATPALFEERKLPYPPEYGPLAAVTPGTPGGLLVMLAEFGTMSLAQVLEPSIAMADGYAIEESQADNIERRKKLLKKWPYSRAVFLPHLGEEREAPHPGEIFVQADLAATLRKLVETERQALAAGQGSEAGDLRGLRPLLQGRHRRRVRTRRQGAGRPDYSRRPRQLEAPHRGAREHELQRHRGLQADDLGTGARHAPSVEHPGERRPPTDGLQLHALRPRHLSGDEPRLRRSRFLLRRPLLPAGRADRRPAFQGVRSRALRADRLGA